MAIKSRLSINRKKTAKLYYTEWSSWTTRKPRRRDPIFCAHPVEWSFLEASVVPGQQPDNREGNGFDLIILNKLAGKGLPPML